MGNHTRSIPTEGLLELAGLYIMLKKHPAKGIPAPLASETAYLQKEAEWHIVQCDPLQKKLAAVQFAYQQGANTLKLLDAYTSNAAEPLSPRKQRWLENQQHYATEKMAKNGWVRQK